MLSIDIGVVPKLRSEYCTKDLIVQQAQGPKTPRPIRSERMEWVRTWYALGMLVYGLGYYGGIRTMYRVSTEWVRTEGGLDENIGLNGCRINF